MIFWKRQIDIAKITSWACDYNTYLKRKTALVEAEEEYHHQFDKKLAIEETWIRQGIRARRTRNEGRVRALLKLREERRNRRSRAGSAKMELQEADRTGKLVIKAKGLSFAYGENENSVLSDFSVTVMRGDRVGIIGPNGSGKTTFLRALLGLVPVRGGGMELMHQGRSPGYVPQQKQIDPLYPVSVRAIIAMGLYPELGCWGRPDGNQRRRLGRCGRNRSGGDPC